jgi:dolichyl-diphosphooligosaccharide--protein glycosyltransferase
MRLAAQILLVGLIFLSVYISLPRAYHQGSGRLVAPQNDWYESLIYLKEETPEDAIIMTWWDYGYWILDIAERTPVVDNGYRPEEILRDIAQVYCTDQDSEAIEVMRKYGASYLVLSLYETDILGTIASYGPDYPYSTKQLAEESLFARFLGEDLQSANRFGKVVIISLKQ